MGAYDFLEEQIELYGSEWVTAMLDKQFEPAYIPGKGWVWLLVRQSAVKA